MTQTATPQTDAPAVPAIFEPIEINGVRVRNRLILPPMCQYSCEARDGVPHGWHFQHLGARAAGGFGIVVAEATAVTPEGRISAWDTGLWNDEQRDAWAPIAEFIASQGALPAIQLGHAGAKASTVPMHPGAPAGQPILEGPDSWETLSPSGVATNSMEIRTHAMRVDEIRETVQAFADAAERADRAGFGAVQLHAAHGYLIHQFLSPLSNTRNDAWGGGFEGRTRLLLDVVDAVRGVWPERLPLWVRISATDWVDGGWDLDQSIALSRLLAARGVDLVDVSSGGLSPAQRIDAVPDYQVPFAARIRREAGIATGAATTNPAVGYAVAVGVEAGTNATVKYVTRKLHQGEQDAISAAAGTAARSAAPYRRSMRARV